MTKLKECPKCKSTNLSDCWQRGRKLRQSCNEDDCNWRGNDRTPEKIKIKATKKVGVGWNGGHQYEIYDRYGHIMVSSQSYGTKAKAKAAALEEKKSHEQRKDKDILPITILIWPEYTIAQAEVIK